MRLKTFLVAVASCAAFAAPVVAMSTITVGTRNLLPNTSGQSLEIFVTGGDFVSGVNLNVQIGDGGSATPGHPDVGPTITAVDLTTNTIFSGNNDGADDPGSFPQLAIRTLLTHSGVVQANNRLATLTISTANVFGGSFPLQLKNTLNGPTDFAGSPANILDGQIVVLPEPGALWLLSASVVLLSRRRTR